MSTRESLRKRGVPDPDGTALGDVLHTLAVWSEQADSHLVLLATMNVYESGEQTGISLGDLRELARLAELGASVEALVRRNA